MVKPRLRLIIIIAVCLLVSSILAVTGISLKVGWKLTHPERKHVVLPAAVRELHPKPVSFPSRQGGITLQGWFLPSGNSNKTIIFAHGYGNNRLQEDVPGLDVALALGRNGYNILMFDFRGCGESSGNLTSIGQFEKDDLIGAVNFMKNMGPQGEHLGVIGFSMGAVTAILAAAEDSRIEAVAADAPFADLEKYLHDNLPVWSDLPSFPFTPVILKIMPVVLNLDPQKVSPEAVIRQIRAPVLFVHGNSDTDVPVFNSEELYRKTPGRNKLWIVPGAGHVGSYRKEPKQYMQYILELFAQI